MTQTSTVSQVARELGRSERWLRNAEAKGKIPKARRDLNGWRVYTSEDIEGIKQLLVPDKQVQKANIKALTPAGTVSQGSKKNTGGKSHALCQ